MKFSKVAKMISAEIKTDVKQEIKKNWYLYLVTFHRSTFSKRETQCKTDLYFSFNLGWHSMQPNIVH